MRVRDAEPGDAEAIAEIYYYYILNSHATFELDPIDAVEMLRRIENSVEHGLPFLVADSDEKIVGYAHAQPYKQRAAYKRSVEISVYISPASTATGIGSALYARLFERLGSLDIHAVIGGISLPNDASVRLHEKFGMTKVAHFREVGNKFGRWIDVGYWQLVLPDRSD